MPIFIKYMHIYSVSLPSSNACWVLVIGLKLDLTVFFLFAAEALAAQVSQENYDKGLIYPPFTNIRKISANIAAEVAAKAYELG